VKKDNRLDALPPKKPNRFLLFIKILLNIIFSKKFLCSSIIIFTTGLLGKYIILTYLQVNVLTDMFNLISISFYGFMSGYVHIIRELFSHLDGNIIMKMNAAGAGGGGGGANPNQAGGGGANPNQAGGGGANPNQGVVRANHVNGPIQVADPNGQNYQYSPVTNQPLLGNIARALDVQASLKLTSLTRYVFSPQQEQYILAYLSHHHQDMYDNLMLHPATGLPGRPQWRKQSNTAAFRNILRDAQ